MSREPSLKRRPPWPIRTLAWFLLPLCAVACFPNPDDLRSSSSGTTGTGGTTGSGGAGGSTCQAPGSSCTANSQCCQTGSGVPDGAFCIVQDNVCHAKCLVGSDCTSGCCVPVTGETFGACAAASNCASKGVGDPCTANSQCASGSCAGWCQASCSATNSVCAATSSSLKNVEGFYNWCFSTSASGDLCFPGCSTSADCTIYGSGLTCKSGVDVNGFTDSVCSL